jgi:hypothetical protein
MSQETLKMVYFAYVHSIMSYGIILGGKQPHGEKIFKIQKKVIRMITNSRARDSCGKINVYFLPQILIEKKYIASISAIFPVF